MDEDSVVELGKAIELLEKTIAATERREMGKTMFAAETKTPSRPPAILEGMLPGGC